MISILLGSLLSLAISNIYLEGIRSYIAEEEMARISDNGRLSLNLLKRELMSAGFYGALPSMDGLSSSAVSTDCVSGGNWALDTSVPLDFINDFSSTASAPLRSAGGVILTCLDEAEISPGTDIVSLKRTSGNYTLRNGVYRGETSPKANRWYLKVADYGAQKQWLYHRSGGFPSADIGRGTRVDYWAYYTQIFYIRKYSEVRSDGIPTLCVERLVGGGSAGAMATRCLAEGVEDMQFEFGLDSNFDGTPNQLRDSLSKPDLNRVVVARIYLLLRSLGQVPGSARSRTYTLGTKQVHRSDGYVRRVISTTVYLPNASTAVG